MFIVSLSRDVISKRSTGTALASTTVENEKTVKNEEAVPNDEMEEVEESVESGVHLDTLTVSMALAQSASSLRKSQLYRYLHKTTHAEVKDPMAPPRGSVIY